MNTPGSQEAVSVAATDLLIASANNPVLATELRAAHQSRHEAAADIRILLREAAITLPELPDQEASEVYDAVRNYERILVAPRLTLPDYAAGTASCADQLFVMGNGPVLAEAQHATAPGSRKRKLTDEPDPDQGTAGIGGLLAERGLVRVIIPLGLQTGNANGDPGHPIKRKLDEESAVGSQRAFLSIHGMPAGKVEDLRRRHEIAGVIGLGLHPSETSWAVAEAIVERLADWGLRLVIGNQTYHVTPIQERGAAGLPGFTEEFVRNKEGRVEAVRLAAAFNNSTTTYMSDKVHSGLQIELSRSLRLRLLGQERSADPAAERMAVFLGFTVFSEAAQISARMVG